ncbi:MATE family efflux transporter [Faecalicatena orotica]|uniref:MATE family efflux transporter n=1 Tax=Faecalicatena orotica TaxID=1544 RepID=UPI000D6D7FCF|nr:MATE family efflux transporter [Faecalicatena orotica]
MRKNVDLLNGPIAGSLARLALPIMGTSLIQMAYNLTDMLWIGRLGSNAVAAVGAAGMYIWLSAGFTMLARMGGQVLTAQSLGAGKNEEAVRYASAALWMGLILGLLYGAVSIVFHVPLVAFFRLNSPEVIRNAQWYLIITCGAIVFNFINQILTGLLTAMGNSITTFWSTTTGLLINLVLDPILIFGPGPLPVLGVKGAAIATVFAQVIVFVIYIMRIRKDPVIFSKVKIFHRPDFRYIKEILLIGLPAAVQNIFFTAISMIIARLIAGWGDAAVAVQKVGSQIESISWMTAEGFGSSVNAFTAQNYGAGKNERVRKGYFTALRIMGIWGVFTTLALLLFPEFLFRLFISEPDVIPMGVDYLRILALSQLFMCTEAASAGTFQGLGKSMPPSLTGITFNLLRIPLAVLLSATVLKLNGIWWSITISSIIKGIILPVWLMLFMHRLWKNKKS